MSENQSASASEHPGPEDIAAYLSDGLGAEERARVEAHLSRCRVCRRQVTSAHALLRSRPRPLRWVAVAAVAGLAIALIGPWSVRGSRTGASPDIERARPTDEAPSIVALTPTDGDTIPASGAVFSWRSRGREVLYRLSVTDPRGQAVWTIDTADTSVVLPSDVRLTAGSRYYWYVDGVGANATSWTTGTRVFVVAP